MKDRIRKILEYTHLSQQDFAARLGISPASLSSIFTGRTNPTNNHVVAVHKAYPEINVKWLMFGEGEMLDTKSVERGSENQESDHSDLQVNLADEGLFMGSSTAENSVPTGISVNETPVQPTQPRSEGRSNAYSAHREPYYSGRATGQMAQNAKNFDKDARKIKEIRVFFSDGTYESFVPSGK